MPAKTLTPEQLDRLLVHVARFSRDPERDRVALLLSFRAGLRAQEIAGLSWSDVTDAAGVLAHTVSVPRHVAKKDHARTIPMHASLREALWALARSCKPTAVGDPVVKGRDGNAMTPNAMAKQLRRLYAAAGLLGCSSQTGRRTFITTLARSCNGHGCSLRDVQLYVGHRYLSSTQAYVEASPNAPAMVRAL